MMAMMMAMIALEDDPPGFSATAAPNPRNPMTLELTPSQVEVEVSPDKNGVAAFEGTVTVDSSRLVSSQVTLSSSCIWPAIVSPSTMEFQGPGSQAFTVSVVVPPRTSSIMVGQLIVDGTYKAPGMPVETAEVSAVVTVAPYHKTSFTFPERNLVLDRGSTGSLDINVINNGNGRFTYEVEALAPEGLSVRFSQMVLELGEDEEATVRMNVSAGRGAPRGDHRITVRVSEAGTTPLVFSEHMFTVRVRTPIGTWVAIVVLFLAAIGLAVALWKGKLRGLQQTLSKMRGQREAS